MMALNQRQAESSEFIPLQITIKPLAMANKPLPPSPRSAPTLLLERQNQALRDEAKLLTAQIDHLRSLLDHYRQLSNANSSFVKESLQGIKQLQDATFLMKREERRLGKKWEEYLRGEGAVPGELANFF